MGHSYTIFREKAILCKDYKLEVWLFLICREIDQMESTPTWLKEARDFWCEQANLSINGSIEPNLEELLNGEVKVNLMIEICERIYKQLEDFGKKIPAQFLNELYKISPESVYSFKEDNEAELYLSYGRALLKLLRNQQDNKLEMA